MTTTLAPRSNMRAWSWVRVDGRNVVAIPSQQQIRLYDSDDFILLSTIAPSGHSSAIAKVRWSAFHAKLASLSATELVVHAPRLVAAGNNGATTDSSGARSKKRHSKVVFAAQWQLTLPHNGNGGAIYSFSFSRCAERLLFSDRNGIGILDIHNIEPRLDDAIPQAQLLWRSTSHVGAGNEIVKFSPSEYVLSSLQAGGGRLQVWRLADSDSTTEDASTLARPPRAMKEVVCVDELAHPDPIVYYSWKPANSQLRSASARDGCHKTQWFEPARVLLTCSICRVIRVWTESDDASAAGLRGSTTGQSHPDRTRDGIPVFTVVLVYQPHEPIDNFRWVLSKNRNISEEKFGSASEQLRSQIDWISGVDQRGVLHLWRLVGVPTATPTIEETGVCIQVNAAESESESELQQRRRQADDAAVAAPAIVVVAPLSEICIMAYFSQDDFATPSMLDIVLQRADSILLSYSVAVARATLRPHVKRKSWYRGHSGAIAALAAHPSLPLIASVGVSEQHAVNTAIVTDASVLSSPPPQSTATTYEILIFWISFSAFSAESRLIPSGVLTCAPECGAVLSVQWVPTLHFDATPLLVVTFASGAIEVYGRTANAAGVVSSPKVRRSPSSRRHFGRAPSVTPWTVFDYNTGESGAEYEVVIRKDAQHGVGFAFEARDAKLVVTALHAKRSAVDQVALGDELVGVNHHRVVGKAADDVRARLDAIPVDEVTVVRFRTKSSVTRPSSAFSGSAPTMSEPPPTSADDDNDAVETHSNALRSSFLSSLDMSNSSASSGSREHARVVPAADVSLYGGWRQLLRVQAAPSLALLCVCPVYVDDGEFASNTVLLFGVTSLPGRLRAWRGVRSLTSASFELTAVNIEKSTIANKHDITSVAGERDYRQRAFSSKRQGDGPSGLNSLLFVGDATGAVQHWRCQLLGDALSFTLMSTCNVGAPLHAVPRDDAAPINRFFRRGYVDDSAAASAHNGELPPSADTAATRRRGTHHIEVDDPNRIAVLDIGQPDTLHIYEAESGLGIMRLEESIASGGRGAILGFSWCSAHVEFNVDVLAVHYVAGLVLYQYDMHAHRWVQIGDDLATPYAIFDCTRDSSALLIGGGFLASSSSDDGNSKQMQHHAVASNEMPEVLGKWDEPGNLLQYSMDWKATESPQKLPVWHPYVVLTTLFGMHARVGVKDTQLAGDTPAYEFARAFKDAVEMLKLLAKVIDDKVSAHVSARSGVLSYSASRRTNGSSSSGASSTGRRDSVGRYSTAVQTRAMSKAEHLFGDSTTSTDTNADDLFSRPQPAASNGRLDASEAAVIAEAIDAVQRGTASPYRATGALLFASFEAEHFVEMMAVLHYVAAMQALGFDLDASAADIGAKRFFSSYMFAKSLKSVLSDATTLAVQAARDGGSSAAETTAEPRHDSSHEQSVRASLDKSPSSGILWALHSDAQQFLIDNCVHPQATWDDLRPMWLGLWVKNTKDLRAVVERLAKSMFARTRLAMDVCLLYIALGKKNVLGALAKISKSEQDKTLALFLDHDFAQERWCTAAVKNAYSLLSKKQYATAAAFFLLCEPPRLQEALRVLTARLGDLSLALVVSRLVEYRTHESFQHDFISTTSLQHDVTSADVVTRALLDTDIVPFFRARSDRWMESCALWWLEDFEQASTVLQPLAQAVDAMPDTTACAYHPTTCSHDGNDHDDIRARCHAVVHFYVNLTSIPMYFQYLHSSAHSALLLWAAKQQQRRALAAAASDVELSALVTPRHHKLATTADIEHAFSFAAYACKRNGLSDTALVEMLQARHLVNVHARFELAAAEAGSSSNSTGNGGATGSTDAVAVAADPHAASPRVRASMRNLYRVEVKIPPHERSLWRPSPRRMSDVHTSDFAASAALSSIDTASSHNSNRFSDHARIARANTTQLLQPSPKPTAPPAPWLKAQIADIECRRWASSAFVGKMVGIRVAREMISHFRAELDVCFRHFDASDTGDSATTAPMTATARRAEPHKEFLEELCAPLCRQFEVDRDYVVEAALGVLQPHAYLHIVEVCFLLSELGRASTLCKWIEYIALSMLHSCATFASCTITDDIYRDWEGLTIQLCYVLHLDAHAQIALPNRIVAHVAVAVRTGIIFLSWCRHESRIIHEAILAPFFVSSRERTADDEYFAELSLFAFEQSARLIRTLQAHQTERHARDASDPTTWNFSGTFGYVFLETVASYLSGSSRAGSATATTTSAAPSTTSVSSASTMSPQREKLASHWRKLRKMYTLILMVSILRTHYARCQIFLSDCATADDAPRSSDTVATPTATAAAAKPRDIASSLFTPRKMWKFLEDAPLDGLKRWYSLMESHLRCEFDYSVKDITCVCGLYGLDGSARKLAALHRAEQQHHNRRVKDDGRSNHDREALANHGRDVFEADEIHDGDGGGTDSHQHHHHHLHLHHHPHLPHLHLRQHLRQHLAHLHHAEGRCDLHAFLRDIGVSAAMHAELAAASDDYVLLLMQHARFGIATRLRRFRVDPRVHVPCFLVDDAFEWLAAAGVCATADASHAFLKRCCKARKLRLLIQQVGQLHHPLLVSGSEGDSASDTSDGSSSSSHGISEPPPPAPPQQPPHILAKLLGEAIMFVNPWEVEAVESALQYMHKQHAPRHVELGWDRLSPIGTETCDDVIATVFSDSELVEMWKATCGEGWLVASISQYQLDGGFAPRSSGSGGCGGVNTNCSSSTCGRPSTVSSYSCNSSSSEAPSASVGSSCNGTASDGDDDDARAPFLVEIHARAQRNAMFREVGLPHRFVGVLSVTLLEGRDLIPCGWILHSSDPYVFLELATDCRAPGASADSWGIDAHRSRVGDGGVNPRWGTQDDTFTFRFAVPTHHVHVRSSRSATNTSSTNAASPLPLGPIENAWRTDVTDESTRAAHGLESLFQAMYTGPPVLLRCSVFDKSKLLPHHFMGKGQVALAQLTSGSPLECWVPLDEVPRGALRLRLALSFRLMCSSVAGAQDVDDILER